MNGEFHMTLKINYKHMKMKNVLKSLFLVAIIAVTTGVSAQKQKIAHINSNELLMAMPQRDSIEKEIQKYAKELEAEMQNLSAEYEQKVQEFNSKKEMMSDLIKETKIKEINNMQQNIQSFQQRAQEDLQQKENELLQPLIQKAQKAIDEVADEQGYDYVLDSSLGVVLFSKEGDDILPLVKEKLDIE